MREIVVRRATIEDADAIWPLASEFATSFQPERAAFDVAIEGLASRRDTYLAVAESNSIIVGYLLASSHLTFLANGHVVWVEELMVGRTFRREGVGRELMRAAEAWAAEQNAAYISLATRRAADFYLALGYEDSAKFFKKTLLR